MKKTNYLVAVTIFALLLLSGCATTRFTGVWHDESYQGGPIKSIMVVGLARNELNRNIFESAMVKAFDAQGVHAIPSRQVLGDEAISKDNVMEAAKKANVQAVLITRLVGVKKQKYYYPPQSYVVPYPYYYRWDTYYPYVYPYPYGQLPYVQSPGYVQTYKYVDLETNIYDSAQHQLIWSAASQSFDSQNINEVVNDLANLLIKDLKRSKLI